MKEFAGYNVFEAQRQLQEAYNKYPFNRYAIANYLKKHFDYDSEEAQELIHFFMYTNKDGILQWLPKPTFENSETLIESVERVKKKVDENEYIVTSLDDTSILITGEAAKDFVARADTLKIDRSSFKLFVKVSV